MHQIELPGLRAPEPAAPRGDLVPQPESPRLLRLLAEHRKLLGQVARKREEVARLEADVTAVLARVMPRMEPLVERMGVMDAEIHGLFAELLLPGRLAKNPRRDVSHLYLSLQEREVLSPAPRNRRRLGHPVEASSSRERAGQSEPGESEPTRGTVREMFLRLATAMHPDRAPNEPERSARTEAMKEVNRAYEAGDLARLLELERSWAASLAPAASDDDGQRRCEFLSRANQALRRQLSSLRQRAREMTDSMPGQLVKQFKRVRGGAEAIEAFIAEGEAELAHLVMIRDHVRNFRDGKLTLRELFTGPVEPSFRDVDIEVDLDELMSELSRQVAQAGPPPSRRSKQRRRPRKRR